MVNDKNRSIAVFWVLIGYVLATVVDLQRRKLRAQMLEH